MPEPKKNWVATLFVVGIAIGAAATWSFLNRNTDKPATSADTRNQGVKYQCPMHPTIIKDEPGTCPICGMNLVAMPHAHEAPTQTSTSKTGRKVKFYRSPMNPSQTSPVPMKDEMGMDYIPVYEDEVATTASSVEGLATVTIDPARQQLIGLRTTEVTAGPVGGGWRTVAKIQVAPPQVRKVNVKVAGYVERVFVDFVGREVRKGEPLFSLYSPDLFAAQNEYLLALRTAEDLERGGMLAESGRALVASARRKLELWDVPRSEIERIERTRQPSKSLVFKSPIQGVVTAKNIVEGSSLSPGDIAYEITDLREIWVLADAYEADLARVKVGMPAALTVKAYPERKFRGRVVFIDPLLDPNTRTLKVHLHFHNPRGELKPEMYGEVSLQHKERKAVRVPFDAVIHSGTRDVVFVALGEGKFQPREVKLGEKTGDYYEVLSGLQAGEKVVTRANFLIDSESRLRASLEVLGNP